MPSTLRARCAKAERLPCIRRLTQSALGVPQTKRFLARYHCRPCHRPQPRTLYRPTHRVQSSNSCRLCVDDMRRRCRLCRSSSQPAASIAPSVASLAAHHASYSRGAAASRAFSAGARFSHAANIRHAISATVAANSTPAGREGGQGGESAGRSCLGLRLWNRRGERPDANRSTPSMFVGGLHEAIPLQLGEDAPGDSVARFPLPLVAEDPGALGDLSRLKPMVCVPENL